MPELFDVDEPRQPRRVLVPAFQDIPDGRKRRVPDFGTPEERLRAVRRQMAKTPTGTPAYLALARQAEELERQEGQQAPGFGAVLEPPIPRPAPGWEKQGLGPITAAGRGAVRAAAETPAGQAIGSFARGRPYEPRPPTFQPKTGTEAVGAMIPSFISPPYVSVEELAREPGWAQVAMALMPVIPGAGATLPQVMANVRAGQYGVGRGLQRGAGAVGRELVRAVTPGPGGLVPGSPGFAKIAKRRLTWEELKKVRHVVDDNGQDMVWGKLQDAQLSAAQFQRTKGGKALDIAKISDAERPTWVLVERPKSVAEVPKGSKVPKPPSPAAAKVAEVAKPQVRVEPKVAPIEALAALSAEHRAKETTDIVTVTELAARLGMKKNSDEFASVVADLLKSGQGDRVYYRPSKTAIQLDIDTGTLATPKTAEPYGVYGLTVGKSAAPPSPVAAKVAPIPKLEGQESVVEPTLSMKMRAAEKAFAIAKVREANLPPVKEGYVRLYRGERGTFETPSVPPSNAPISETMVGGRWFTPDPGYASFYGPNLKYVDVPKVIAEEAGAGRAATGGNLSIEWSAKAKPVGAPPVQPPKPPVAQAAPPPEPPKAKPEFAANIRLSKYPEADRAEIKAWAAAHPDEVQTARRGVRSDEQVLSDAQRLVEEVGGDFTRLQRQWRPSEAWNAEELVAIRGLLRTKTEEVMSARDALKGADSTANQLRLAIGLQEQARVQTMVHGVTAEAGRALRSFRQEAFDAINANDTQKMEELLRRIGHQGRKGDLQQVAEVLSALDLNNPEALNAAIRQFVKPKWYDYITEIFINSILSGPKTHIINALSNTVTTMSAGPERIVAAGVETVLARVQRRKVERFLEEATADLVGAFSGVPEGIRAALYTMKHGMTPTVASKWEFRPHAFKGKVGRVINAPVNALEAADAMNKLINYRAAFNASAVRMARKEGLKGKAYKARLAELKVNPSPELMQQADDIAEYRLFRGDPGAVATWLIQGREQFPALRFVLPFIRTPTNLVKFGMARSPLGVLNPRLWRNLASKTPEASDQIARILLGSTVAAGVAWYFAEGRITGAVPSNRAERDRFYREGKQPFSIRVGNTWIQYQRLEPLNQTLSQVAAVVEAVTAEGKDVDDRVSQAVFSIGQNLVSQTYVSAISDLIELLTQPERGTQFVERQIGSLIVPFSAAARTGAQMIDPIVRDAKTFTERVAANVPGLSQRVPPKLTAFGEEVERRSPAWSPIVVSPATTSKVDAELGRLGIDVGFAGTTVAGKKLTREQQSEYQQTSGQLIKSALEWLVSSEAYRRLTDADKEMEIRREADIAREEAREQLGLVEAKAPAFNPKKTVPNWGGGSGGNGAVFQKKVPAWSLP